MSELLPCPFCKGSASLSITGGNDERSGYNFSAVATCQTCGASVTESSLKDKSGWCLNSESGEIVAARCAVKWNTRTSQPVAASNELKREAIINALMRDKNIRGYATNAIAKEDAEEVYEFIRDGKIPGVYLSDLQPVAVSAWVKCSERMPEPPPAAPGVTYINQMVWVLAHCSEWTRAMVAGYYWGTDPIWYDEQQVPLLYAPEIWMPLPSPPAALSGDGEVNCSNKDCEDFPHYGVAPHVCFHRRGPEFRIGQSLPLPTEKWPKNFVPDAEEPSCGVYYCPVCGSGNARLIDVATTAVADVAREGGK